MLDPARPLSGDAERELAKGVFSGVTFVGKQYSGGILAARSGQAVGAPGFGIGTCRPIHASAVSSGAGRLGRMSVRTRVILLVFGWVPIAAMYLLAWHSRVPVLGQATIVLALVGASLAATVGVMIGMARKGHVPWSGLEIFQRKTPPPGLGEATSFQFALLSWKFAVIAGAVFLLGFSAKVLARGGSGEVDFLTFGLGLGVVVSAGLALAAWKGRCYVDVLDDRVQVQEALWRSRGDEATAAGFPVTSITSVAVKRGWGMSGRCLTVDVRADTADEVFGGASIPLGETDRLEGERCLSRLLEVVPPQVVDEGVLHLRNALALLETAMNRSGDSSWAGQALPLVSVGRLEDAVQLLSTATESAELRRAGAELAEVARSCGK